MMNLCINWCMTRTYNIYVHYWIYIIYVNVCYENPMSLYETQFYILFLQVSVIKFYTVSQYLFLNHCWLLNIIWNHYNFRSFHPFRNGNTKTQNRINVLYLSAFTPRYDHSLDEYINRTCSQQSTKTQ